MLEKIPLRKYPELDSLRFVSIFLVVCHHQFLDQNAFLIWTKKYAWVGVDVFFVLSGFLITTLLFNEFQKSGQINLKKFWFKRILRLWPSWLLTLFISTAFVFYLSRNNPDLRSALESKAWHYYLHFGNYSHGIFGKLHTLFSHFWSLAVEEHFYLLWPLILLFSLKKKKFLPFVLSILLILPLLFRLYHGQNGADFAFIKLSTHTRFDELIAGSLLALIFERINNLNFKSELLFTASMVSCFYIGLHVLDDTKVPWYLSSFNFNFIALGSVLCIIIAMRGTSLGLRRLLQNPLISRLGILSYNIYLVHFITISFVFAILSKFPITNNHMLIMPTIFLLTLPTSYFMYIVIDQRIEKIKAGLK